MWRSTLNRTALLLAVPALVGARCTTIQRYEVRETERMLAAAGFHMRPADTHDPQANLRWMPPLRIVSETKDGNVVYTYADPDSCHCVYVGGDKEYSEYQRLRVKRGIGQRTSGSSPSGGAVGGAP